MCAQLVRASVRVSERAPALHRGMATRRPERPQPRFPDPLLSPSAKHYKLTGASAVLTLTRRTPPSIPAPDSLASAPTSPLLRAPTRRRVEAQLPPPMHGALPAPKTHHLSEAQMDEIRRLRAEDPERNTRSVLAKRFGTTSWFISTISAASKERRDALDAHIEKRRAQWGERKVLVRAIREKRRSFW